MRSGCAGSVETWNYNNTTAQCLCHRFSFE